MGIALLLVSTTAVALGSFLISAALPRRGAFAYLLAVALIGWATVNVIISVAGTAFADLSPATLAALAALWLAGALAVARRNLDLGMIRSRTAGSVQALVAALRWPPVAVAAPLVILVLLWRTVLAVRLPVVDLLGWQYHLVTVDVWLQSNQLVRVAQNVWTDGWPAAGEMLTTWLAAFTRDDGLTGFTGLLPIPMAMVATSGLARSFGVGRRSALLAGLLVGMLPAAVVLAGTTYPDTGFTAAVIATWWLGLRVLRGEREGSTLVLLGAAAGLALGTKGTGIPLLAPMLAAVGLALVGDLVASARARTGVGRAIVAMACLGMPILVLGLSWYVKNLLIHGNPLYPVAIGPFAGPVHAGAFGAPPVPSALSGFGPLEQTLRSWISDWHRTTYAYNQHPGGFGLAWLVVVPLAIIGLIVIVRRREFAGLGLVVLPALITLAAMTSPWYARYTLFLAGVAMPLAGVALHRFRARAAMAISLAVVGLASVSLFFANAHPNIRLPLAGGPVARVAGYVSFVLTAPDATRADVDRRKACAALGVIQPGDRVVVSSGFFVPHAVVGPRLDRILAAPLPRISTLDQLVAAMVERHATWLVTSPNALALEQLAASDSSRFEARGTTCHGGNLWRFVPGT